MRWRGRSQSSNVEDRRGSSFPGGRGGGVSCVGLLIVIGIAWLTGANPQQLLSLLGAVQEMALPPSAQQAPGGSPPADDPEANEASVRLELQADCFAGVFGRHTRQWLEPGDVEEGLRAAAAIGDDMRQKRAQGYASPESCTHGSSDMRVRWLRRGLESGDPQTCDTFEASRL